ncbi:uncharacterized protein ARMOST_02201 [Armillaria ostoyae]|uniref:Uncharacterized protein n=1 Tax=Armillaria ostoyae TaxID=47428 RepID=A0A284QR38_ARMOS|nr:uncharacterized protein ARMOST_02201 [Armillaria ostoyae]
MPAFSHVSPSQYDIQPSPSAISYTGRNPLAYLDGDFSEEIEERQKSRWDALLGVRHLDGASFTSNIFSITSSNLPEATPPTYWDPSLFSRDGWHLPFDIIFSFLETPGAPDSRTMGV